MRITVVAMGWENISLEYISSYVKERGHEVRLAYEQALFDDKNYLCMPFLARRLDQGTNLIQQIIESEPDLVAFSTMVFTYPWALQRARELKRVLDVPVLFGGSHAICCPERIIEKDAVDIVCVGEGEHATADVLDSMAAGAIDTSIAGLWFKLPDGRVIRNDRRPLIADLDTMPLPDKDLFAPVIPIRNYYLAVTNRGCPFSCTYCSVSYLTEVDRQTANFRKVRERSVDSVLEELRINLRKYDYKWVDFRNAVFSPSPKWILEFCERYRREINRPFRVFGHPLLIREDTSIALRDAGCFAIQIGLESYDPHVRREILNRRETQEEIHRALDILERNRVRYSLDYILGLPEQGEPELKAVAKTLAGLKYCYRISPFMISYLPKVPLLDYAVEHGLMPAEERAHIEEGEHGNYMDKGSKLEREQRSVMEMYKLFFRSMSFMPSWLRKLANRLKAYHLFRILPLAPVLRLFDLSMVFRDRDAQAYALNYWWWWRRRFDAKHPNYHGRRLRDGIPAAPAEPRQRIPMQVVEAPSADQGGAADLEPAGVGNAAREPEHVTTGTH
jgi:anaerobic magnesium-protoporphyrin IX monomethyl ester cyclase